MPKQRALGISHAGSIHEDAGCLCAGETPSAPSGKPVRNPASLCFVPEGELTNVNPQACVMGRQCSSPLYVRCASPLVVLTRAQRLDTTRAQGESSEVDRVQRLAQSCGEKAANCGWGHQVPFDVTVLS